jgi:hypothetical protein
VTKRRLATAAAVAMLALGVSGCSKMNEPFQDAERGSTNNDPADTITFPDGFSNVASKCDGPNRVYVIFKSDSPYGSLSVVKDDPRCTNEVP